MFWYFSTDAQFCLSVTSRGAYSGQGPSFTPPSLDRWAQDSRNGVPILIIRQLRVQAPLLPSSPAVQSKGEDSIHDACILEGR